MKAPEEADLLVVEGNPEEDTTLLHDKRNLTRICKQGPAVPGFYRRADDSGARLKRQTTPAERQGFTPLGIDL